MTVTAAIVFVVALIPSIAPAFCPGGNLEESYIYGKVLPSINNKRSDVVKGADPLPKGKNMNKLDWSCTLEQEAIAFLGDDVCLEEGPTGEAPENKAFINWDEAWMNIPVDKVIEKWYEEAIYGLKSSPSMVDSTNSKVVVATTDPDRFLNLIRASTTEIGCAQKTCDDGIYVLCLTNQPQLKNEDTIYEVGDGKCTSEACGLGRSCDSTGLCEIAAETTTTAAKGTATTAKETTTTTPASYPGELPSGTNTRCSSNVGMTDELRMHFLDTQNYRRSILAKGQVQRPSGNYLPTGANIIKLDLNCTLENEAIKEVRKCPTSKPRNPNTDMYGKNFDTFASSAVVPTYRDAVKKAVTNWWKVVRTETNGPGVNQVTFRLNHVNQPVESYTQIAWANTKKIGCAIAKCSSSYTVMCLYDPKGNIVDQVLYMKGSPCAACPTTCDSALGLCVPRS